MNNAGPRNRIKPLHHLSLLIVLVILLTGCYFPDNPNTPNNLRDQQNEDLAPPSINIIFTLQLFQPIPDGEQIFIEILDEVTGLPYHTSAHVLEKITDLEYTLQVAFPAGSVVKYRYVKLGQSRTPEAQPNGEPVRYRLCYVANAIEIVDQLGSWLGEINNHQQGVLTGRVQDRDTHKPIPDILISAAGQITFTDANGQFVLDKLPPGVHNVVAYAIDGSYQTFQQGAQISPGLTTQANLNLQVRPVVQVTFNVLPPGEAQGAPIYLAGNLAQLGNTFTDLTGSMSILPKKMPTLTQNEDGSYSLVLQLYTGTDLRYKFTLGDGFWNAERDQTGETITRQLIIPNQDITIDHQIISWRSANTEPITFDINLPIESRVQDEIFIQFHAADWTEPIPLWPTGGGNYLYILFSPLDEISSLGYRFCRNGNCQYGIATESSRGEIQIQPSTPSQTIVHTLDTWKNWEPISEDSHTADPIFLPPDPEEYATIIELTPEMDTRWDIYTPIGLSNIANSGASTVIFTPRWGLCSGDDRLEPIFGITPYFYQLSALLHSAKSFHLRRGLFPQVQTNETEPDWWNTLGQTKGDKERWQDSYRRFMLNYAKIAENTQAEWLIFGGKAFLPSLGDEPINTGVFYGLAEEDEIFWQELITDVRKAYHGQILWATHVHRDTDPLPEFVGVFDGIYIMVDSPLAGGPTATAEEIAVEFSQLIDNHIYEIYRSTEKPVFLALAYPSAAGAAQGCLLINQDCINDGLFLPGEMDGLAVDQEEQHKIYTAILPVIASREWIAGTSIRGYEPTIDLQDSSASISGKTAMNLIRDWFVRINTP